MAYFGLLLLISFITGRNRATDNAAFFLGNRQSPWWIVAIGMVGSSLSGVSFVSVPGMVRDIDFAYMQTVVGFFFGYIVIAKVLLPLYYRLHLTTIYTYLDERIGTRAHKTGAWFFFISKLIGAAVRLYIVALMLQYFVASHWNLPFGLTVCIIIVMIWTYTFRSGIKTIVWTDTLQTVCMMVALVLIIINTVRAIDLPPGQIAEAVRANGYARVFVWDDWLSKQHFLKQFFSGIFIAIVMTGLDQDMMQKNLTCRSLKDAQKNMYWYGFSFIPVNLLFLSLGALLLVYAQQGQIPLPAMSDDILPEFAIHYLGGWVPLFFAVGIVAAAFSSADSALAALTTSFAVDILRIDETDTQKAKRSRMLIHVGISITFAVVILLFRILNNTSVIDAIYVIVSYTYGPLLGMYAFGLLTKRRTNDRWVPYIAVAAPVSCYLLNWLTKTCWQYAFGYELLMLNGMLTFAGLWLAGRNRLPETPKQKQL